jgi:Flp pilus assembly pilin Flp
MLRGMNKIAKNQNGYTAIESFLLILILIAVVVIGYIDYKDHHKSAETVTGKWSSYTDATGNFKVMAPVPSSAYKPTLIPQSTQSHNGLSYTVNGVAFVNTYIEGGEDDVEYSTFSSSADVPSLASALKSVLQNHNYSESAHLIKSNQTNVNGNQAETYELTFIAENNKVFAGGGKSLVYDTGEIVRDGKVLYQVDASSAGNSKIDQADRNYFISSFKTLN